MVVTQKERSGMLWTSLGTPRRKSMGPGLQSISSREHLPAWDPSSHSRSPASCRWTGRRSAGRRGVSSPGSRSGLERSSLGVAIDSHQPKMGDCRHFTSSTPGPANGVLTFLAISWVTGFSKLSIPDFLNRQLGWVIQEFF